MDDCSLQKLSTKPGQLSPAFKSAHTDYHVTVGSDVESVVFDCLANDSGASYNISGAEGGKSVKLKEGLVNDVKIEVTAEDGTTQFYLVHIKRLSAKDATLSDLQLTSAMLQPSFSADILEYTCLVACDMASITVNPAVASVKTALLVDGEKPGVPINLSVGRTKVNIQVTSADESTVQIYTVIITKTQMGRYVKLCDQETSKYQCPISLSPVYCPVNIKDSDSKYAISAPILEEFTKTSKVDPLTDIILHPDWRIENYDLDKEMSSTLACIPLIGGGFSEKVKLGEIGKLLKACHQSSKHVESTNKYETNVAVQHKVEVRNWEKKLQKIYDESDPVELSKMAREHIEKYLSSIPQPGAAKRFEAGESPLDYLQNAIHCYATAIKHRAKDANLHLQLALTLEEKYHAEDILGMKDVEEAGFPSMNFEAKESSKSDECAAICKLRGVSDEAPLASELKAIDEEYHHLLSSGQSAKADHVQALYAWKSKQAMQGGVASQKAEDDQSSLGQACLKYLDAVILDDARAVHHFHVGRMLVMQGHHAQAVARLEAALGWNAQHQAARFYLGVALSLQPEGPGARLKATIGYLMEGLEALLQRSCEEASQVDVVRRTRLYAEDLLSPINIQALRGIIQLGKLRSTLTEPIECMSAEDILHNVALLVVQVLPSVARGGDHYAQTEWALLEAHAALLQRGAGGGGGATPAARRGACLVLAALIRRSTLPRTADLLQLQRQTGEMLVEMQPCSSYALHLLGNTQLTQFDNEPPGGAADELLNDAKRSFGASITMEGKPMEGEPPQSLAEQIWWLKKVKLQKDAKAVAELKASPPKVDVPPKGAASPSRGGGTVGKAARGGAVPRGGVGRAVVAGRGGAAPPRGGAVAPRGGVVAARGGKTVKNAPVKSSSKSCVKTVACEETKTDAKEAVPEEKVPDTRSAEKSVDAPLNRKTHHARLGMARALAKSPDQIQEAKRYYDEVMDISPEIHDAYVESAEMLVKTDPMAAVDIYSRFPISDDPSFDDAFIFGEIVRLLMKSAEYDDSRLSPNLIAMGRVMGLGVLERYVTELDNKGKSQLLKTVYAGVNHKQVDDPDMQAFFKLKCWI